MFYYLLNNVTYFEGFRYSLLILFIILFWSYAKLGFSTIILFKNYTIFSFIANNFNLILYHNLNPNIHKTINKLASKSLIFKFNCVCMRMHNLIQIWGNLYLILMVSGICDHISLYLYLNGTISFLIGNSMIFPFLH